MKGRRRGRPPNAPSRTARREALEVAALAVIGRDGPAASMQAIAAEAGVTKPVVYAHFGDKAGLSAAIAARVAAQLVEQVGRSLDAVAADGATDPLSAIPVMVETFVGFVEADPELFSYLLFPSAGRSPGEDLRSLIETLAALLEPFFAVEPPGAASAIAVDRRVSSSDAMKIRAALGLAYTSVDWWIRGGAREMDREEFVAAVTDLVRSIFEAPDRAGMSAAGRGSSTGR